MSLGLKSLVLIAVAMTLSVLAQFSVIGKVALPGLVTAERGAALERLKRARTAVDESRRSLDNFARDWAAWQETAAFLAEPTANYPFSELVTGSLLAEDIDLFGLYGTDGSLIWGALPERRLASIDIKPEKLEAFLADGAAELIDQGHPSSGVMDLSSRAAIYSIMPVTYESYGASVVGYLAMLRFIDGTMVTRWERLVGGPLELFPVASHDKDDSQGQDDASLGGGEIDAMRIALEGSDGKAAFWLEIAVEDKSFQAARTSLRDAMNYTLVIGGVTFFVLLGGLQYLLLRPLARLVREVLSLMTEDRAYSMKRLMVRGHDEVAVIASEINEILERLEAAVSQLQKEAPRPNGDRLPEEPRS